MILLADGLVELGWAYVVKDFLMGAAFLMIAFAFLSIALDFNKWVRWVTK